MNFYKIRLHMLPLRSRFIVITLGPKWSGARWAIPAKVLVDKATDYYEKHGWDEDVEASKQPKGKELRGIVEVNAELVEHALECQWNSLRPHAKHISGPRTEPRNDQLWWVEENGGRIEELTTTRVQKPWRGHLLWTDSLDATKGVALIGEVA